MKSLKSDDAKVGRSASRERSATRKAHFIQHTGKASGSVAYLKKLTRKDVKDKVAIARELRKGRFLENVAEFIVSGSRADLGNGFLIRMEHRSDSVVAVIEPIREPSRTPEVDAPDLELEEALVAARARGKKRAAEIVAGPEMLTAEAMGDRLGVSRMTVNTWRENGRLLGLIGTKRGYRFPDWQLDSEGQPYEELRELSDLLGNPWTVYRFLAQPHGELDGATGLQALKDGKGAAVLSVAESVGRDFS